MCYYVRMEGDSANRSSPFGKNLREARLARGLSQTQLARLTKSERIRLIRIEQGTRKATWNEALDFARVLKIPLERLISGRLRPAINLRGIAFELLHLGVVDLEIADAEVPGAFRRPEQILVLAVKGDRPEPRVVEAIPFVLARQRLQAPLVRAFAEHYDRRAIHRLAWLSDITLTISRLAHFPIELRTETQLETIVRLAKKPKKPDSLGHPQTGKLPPVSKRWNVTYACDLKGFLQRTIELHSALQQTIQPPEFDE